MNSSSFIKTLRSLSRENIKKFEDLVCSPYFNKNSNVITFLKYIIKFYPDFKSEKLEKAFIWKALFSERKFNYGVMKNLIYELNKLLEKFLILETFDQKESQQKIFLLQNLFDKGLALEFQRNVKILKKKISDMELSIDYFYQNLALEKLEKGTLDMSHKAKNKNFGNYNLFNKYFLSYFFSYFFLMNHKGLIISNMYSVNIDNQDLKKVLRFFEKEYFGHDILSMCYYYSIKLAMQDRNEKLFFEVKDFVFKNFTRFDRLTKYNACTVLLRSCSEFSMNDDTKFARETFLIMEFMAKNKIYNSNIKKYIDQTFYYMAVDIAAHLNETQWCENFIKEYKDKLDPLVKENYVNLSMMLLKRSEKNYNESLRYLSKVKPDNPLQKLTVKEFELKNFYDLGYYDEIISLIKNNKNFLIHDKTYSGTVRESVNNLMTYLKKVLDIKMNTDNKKKNLFVIERISKEINSKDVFNKNWLLNILNETKVKL